MGLGTPFGMACGYVMAGAEVTEKRILVVVPICWGQAGSWGQRADRVKTVGLESTSARLLCSLLVPKHGCSQCQLRVFR